MGPTEQPNTDQNQNNVDQDKDNFENLSNQEFSSEFFDTVKWFSIGAKKGDAGALEWLVRKATQGNPNAQYELGMLYKDGVDSTKDANDAMELFSKAAEQGHIEAQYELGKLYIFREGCSRNTVKGVELIKDSADRGCTGAQIFLGNMYRDGYLVPKDKEKSEEYFKKAEEGSALE